eukprot:3367253-Rhodomonas_salina.1
MNWLCYGLRESTSVYSEPYKRELLGVTPISQLCGQSQGQRLQTCQSELVMLTGRPSGDGQCGVVWWLVNSGDLLIALCSLLAVVQWWLGGRAQDWVA